MRCAHASASDPSFERAARRPHPVLVHWIAEAPMHVTDAIVPAAPVRPSAAAAAARYPVELIDVWHLPDGRRVLLRPMLPQDEPLFDAFVPGLAPRSRLQRFHAPMAALTAGSLARLTRVDHREHVALIASVFGDGVETGIAEARYCTEPAPGEAPEAGSAEFAVAVADDWQGRGIGGRLMRALLEAAGAAGVERLHGDLMADNTAMVALSRSLGARIRRHPTEPWLLRAEIALDGRRPGAGLWPGTACAEKAYPGTA
jgi:GNAT superfamily N-acetyltransferase